MRIVSLTLVFAAGTLLLFVSSAGVSATLLTLANLSTHAHQVHPNPVHTQYQILFVLIIDIR